MKLWHVVEGEGVGSSDPRVDWFTNKKAAMLCRATWLSEHQEEADEGEDVTGLVEVLPVDVPTTRDALARWLFAYNVKAG
jgi:hypothetical protein